MKRHLIETLDGGLIPAWIVAPDTRTVYDFGGGSLDRAAIARSSRLPQVDVHRRHTLATNLRSHGGLLQSAEDVYKRSLARLCDKQGRTGVLVAAGPSAADIKGCLGSLPDNVDVWGVNRGAKYAQDAGRLSGCFFFESLPDLSWFTGVISPDDVPLVCFPTSGGSLATYWGQTENIYYGWCHEIPSILEGNDHSCFGDIPAIATGGSSALGALHAMVEMGYSKIIIVGVDFAAERYSDGDGTFYADGQTTAECYYGSSPNRWLRVMGADEEWWGTNMQMLNYCASFEACLRSARDRGVDVVYSGRGIVDASHVPFKEAVNE